MRCPKTPVVSDLCSGFDLNSTNHSTRGSAIGYRGEVEDLAPLSTTSVSTALPGGQPTS